MTEFFEKLDDKDFFSDKLTHIYFNGEVNETSVNKLTDDIRSANNIAKPKPILIHINSYGGSVYEGMVFLSIFKISSVPIATIIDNYSFSAATFLSIHSPYRLMTKNSFCLLHQYSVSTQKYKRELLFSKINEFEEYFKKIISMYLKKTKLKKEELNELLQHDLYIDYKYCLEKGIVDRIIDFETKTPELKKDIYQVIKDNKTINIYLLPCSKDIKDIDLIIRTNNKKKSNIYLIYPYHNNCYSTSFLINNKEPENNSDSYDIFHSINLINRIKAINGTKIAIIDTPTSIDSILALLYTNKIYIYSHSFIICNLLYFKNYFNNILMIDVVKNYNIIFNRIKTILKQKTKMSLDEISNINKKYIIIHPKEAVKMGLCHEIIYS